MSLPLRTTNTGTEDLSTTRSETLPIDIRFSRGLLPWVPMMIRSTPRSSVYSRIVLAGVPCSTASVASSPTAVARSATAAAALSLSRSSCAVISSHVSPHAAWMIRVSTTERAWTVASLSVAIGSACSRVCSTVWLPSVGMSILSYIVVVRRYRIDCNGSHTSSIRLAIR